MFLKKLTLHGARPTAVGFSVLESLMALPVLLFVAFVIIQIGLLWHARFALSHAALMAARHASVHHGDNHAIRDGLVQGLMPFVSKADTLSVLPSALFRSGAELSQGIASGWIRWEVLSPSRESFDDWGVIADPFLSRGAATGELEIPATQLGSAILHLRPSSGIKGYSDRYPIGSRSGQTLIDANVLKLRLRVGVPLNMPLAGPLMARALAVFAGCGWFDPSAVQERTHIGLVDFGRSARVASLSPLMECRALAARDIQGHWRPRWPVSVTVSVLMQSNPRRSMMQLSE